MKTIGITGGCSLCELGPAADVELFFECIRLLVVPSFLEQDWTSITDRLYRRYLRLDELPLAVERVQQVRQVFERTTLASIELSATALPGAQTRLALSASSADGLFANYFKAFAICEESARLFLKSFQIYQPVRLVLADLPDFIKDKKRPLADYDTLEGKPFWTRHIRDLP